MTRLYTPMFRSNIPTFLNSVGLEKKTPDQDYKIKLLYT